MSPAVPCCVPYRQNTVLNHGAHARLSATQQNTSEIRRVPEIQHNDTDESDTDPPLLVHLPSHTTVDMTDMDVVDSVDPATILRNVRARNNSCCISSTFFCIVVMVVLFLIGRQYY